MSISSVTAPAGAQSSTSVTPQRPLRAHWWFRPGFELGTSPDFAVRNPQNQDSCENTTFRFDFQGTATFNVVPSTSTLLSSSHNPSVVDSPLPIRPLSFPVMAAEITTIQQSNRNCDLQKTAPSRFAPSVPVSGNPDGSSTATCTPPTYLVTGTIRSQQSSRTPTGTSRIRRPRC